MKKIAAFLLSAVMLLGLCACSADAGPKTEEPVSAVSEITGGITGGWDRADSPVLTDAQKQVFDEAVETLTGMEYIPVAYIGSQVVAGTNHAVMCRARASYSGTSETWAIVYIYEDPEGNVSIIGADDFGSSTQIEEETLDGGWYMPGSPEITDEVKDALDKAQEVMTGASFEPVALLSAQVVGGMNYCVLCEKTATVPGAQSEYVLVYIYADFEGGADITDIVELPSEDTAQQQQEEYAMQIANPFVDYDSLDDAAKAAGFELTAPDSVEGYGEKKIQFMNNSMIQVIYLKGDSRLFVRKQAGSGDISGDYNKYSDIFGIEIGDYVVEMKGNGDRVNVATWTDNGYTYAVMSDEALTVDEYTDIISGVR